MAHLSLVQEPARCECGQAGCFTCDPRFAEAVAVIGEPHTLEGIDHYLRRAARAKTNRARHPAPSPAFVAQADEAIREHDRARGTKRRFAL